MFPRFEGGLLPVPSFEKVPILSLRPTVRLSGMHRPVLGLQLEILDIGIVNMFPVHLVIEKIPRLFISIEKMEFIVAFDSPENIYPRLIEAFPEIEPKRIVSAVFSAWDEQNAARDGYGSDFHPNEITQRLLAQSVTDALKKWMKS